MPKLTAVATACAVAVLAILVLIASSPNSVTPPHIPENSFTGLIPPWPVFNVAVKINSFFATAARITTPPDVAALELATAWWKSEVVYGLGYNGVFDLLASRSSSGSSSGGMTCRDVATELDLQEFVVCQYMEAGVQLHVIKKDDSSDSDSDSPTYSLTPVGDMYLKENLHSFLMMINEETRDSWRGASTVVIKSGKVSGFQASFGGMDFWTYHNDHPEKEAQFDRAMKSLSPGPTGAMISDWKPSREDIVLCDIGGGIGHVLGHVLEHYPRMRGMVLDQPESAKRANEYMKERGLSDRAEAVGGSFFDPFPEKFSECDVYHLRYIIHDWPDKESVLLLKNIKESAARARAPNNPNRKKSVVIVDQVIDTGASPSMEQSKRLMSINMVASNPYGSRERTVSEHEELLTAAGFRGAKDIKVTSLRTIQTLLEAEI